MFVVSFLTLLTCGLPDSVRVTRETEPENIDKLQRKKLELEVEKWKCGEWYNGSMRDARSSGFVRAGARVR